MTKEADKTILVGVGLKSEDIVDIKESLFELSELTETAGGEIVGSLTQQLEKWNSSTLIGSGKVKEIKEMIENTGANKVIIDHHISGIHQRNLEKILEIPVIDRTVLILDIFAQRAQTREGQLQVELAQVLDQKSRQVGAWLGSLSRLGGGIGTRGPGEKALEIDRRTLHRRIEKIRARLEQVRKHRSGHRAQRRRNKIPSFALIGYTNAGKSTLLNALTNATVLSEDKLFATLDPTTRKVYLPETPNAVITDTVGFINKLPTELVEAFKATLEEAGDSDVLIHVIDLSNRNWKNQLEVTNKLIQDLKWTEKTLIHAFNKVDEASESAKFGVSAPNRTFISAKTGEGLEKLRSLMSEALLDQMESVELFFPIQERHKVYELSRDGNLVKEEESTQGIVCYVQLTAPMLSKWSNYLVTKEPKGH